MLNLFWLIPLAVVFSYLVNYFADVMPLGMGLETMRCKNCTRVYSLIDYIKFSDCSACGKKLSIRHWIVLFVSITATILLWIFPPLKSTRFTGFSYSYLFLFFYFMLVFIIDLEHREILYLLSAVGLVTCIGIGIWLHQDIANFANLSKKPLLNGTINTLLGLITGALIMFCLYLIGLLFIKIVSRIKKEQVSEVALGFGDVILAGILGALLGYPGIFACLILGILMGGFFSLIFIIAMKIKGKFQALAAIPYAPFLIVSAMILLYTSK